MANITIDALNRGWTFGFVAHASRTLRKALQERVRRRQEMHQYSRDEITKFGISPFNIWNIANETTLYNRDEEFRSALNNYIAGYKKHRAIAQHPRWTRLFQ